MSEENVTLMAVSKTLYKLPGQASDVHLTCPDSRFGRTALYLDARMRSVDIRREGKQLKIYWKTFEERERNMILEIGAISQLSTIHSVNQNDIPNSEYRAGDKFLFTPTNREEYSKELLKCLGDNKVICEIEGYLLFDEGDIGFAIRIIEPDVDFRWGLRAEDMNDFMYLGPNYEDARFIFIDE